MMPLEKIIFVLDLCLFASLCFAKVVMYSVWSVYLTFCMKL